MSAMPPIATEIRAAESDEKGPGCVKSRTDAMILF